MNGEVGPTEVLNFWFDELAPAQWWRVDEEMDQLITRQFAGVHAAAAAGELFAWREHVRGRLAEIIVLDQFSRNIYRGKAGAFAQDAQALALAQETVHNGLDTALPMPERGFLYMPYMHSESALVHVEALRLFEELGDASQLEYEQRHKAIIDRFGRYPHRNAILGRDSSPEELEFLQQPGSGF